MRAKTYFLIPENLDLGAFCPDLSRNQRDKRHYLIDSLYRRGHICKYKEADFIPVNYQVLREVVGWRDSAQVKDDLVKWGVLEADGMIVRGEKSCGYRFAPPYRTKFHAVPVFCPSFAVRIAEAQFRRQEAVLENPSFRYVFDCLKRLVFDFDAARHFVETTHRDDNHKRESRLRALEWIEEGDWRAFADRQGRFYTNFVQMAKDVRQFATLDGLPIFQADYSSFQPALLATFYPRSSDERKRFIGVIHEGFYKIFSDRYKGKTFDLEDEEQKRAFKDLVFSHHLFCSTGVRSEMRDIFEAEFPELAEILFRVKGGRAGVAKEHYSVLPKRLQGLESGIVMQTVIPRLIEKYPGIPLLSVHDCIATTEKHLRAVEGEMRDAFMAKAGFEVPVKSCRVSR